MAGYSNTEVQVSQDDDGGNVILNDIKTVPIDLGSYTDDRLVVSTPVTDPNEFSPYVIQDALSVQPPYVFEANLEAPTLESDDIIIVDPSMDVRDVITTGGDWGEFWPEFKDNGAAFRICYRHKECGEWYYYPDRVKDKSSNQPTLDGINTEGAAILAVD